MQKKRLFVPILAMIVIMALLSACGGGNGNSESSDSGAADDTSQSDAVTSVEYAKELDVIIDNNKIAAVNPLLASANTSPTTWVFNMIYNSLVERKGEGYVPSLATSWETTDWQHLTFKLRDDVTFHNGEKFTAADVIYTIEAAREAVGTQAHDRWADVETATAIDEYTLEFTLLAPNVDFLYNLSQPQSGILNEAALTASPEEGAWIGTGAWVLTDFATNDYVKMSRNDNYWGEKALTEKITLRFVPEISTRLMMLQNGETDVCFSIDPNDLPLLEAEPDKYTMYQFVYNNLDLMGFNMKDPICGDYNFRMAVASALDREEITLACCGDYGIPETTGTAWGYETEFRNNDIPIIPYDPEKAKEYLAASPYNGEEIELTTAIATNVIASEVIQQQLAQVGIKVKINQLDPPAMASYCSFEDNKSQMFVFIGPQTLSAFSVRNLYYPGAGYNRVSYVNDEVTAMLDNVSTIIDTNERGQAYRDLQTYIAQDPPYLNLFWLVSQAACVKGVGGMDLTADSYFDLTYIYKEI
jgi:peptide/nickel transport system substrate-binding protein